MTNEEIFLTRNSEILLEILEEMFPTWTVMLSTGSKPVHKIYLISLYIRVIVMTTFLLSLSTCIVIYIYIQHYFYNG